LKYTGTTGWVWNTVESGTAEPYLQPTISSSKTGTYLYWHIGAGFASAWMRRKVFALSGSITENMFWTGNNWISADTYIEAGYTVTAKTGSNTYILANNTLVVRGTLLVEPGAEFYFEPGAQLQVDGTLNVQASPSDHAIFTRSGTTGVWNGISSGPYAPGSVTLNYADISYATTGIRLDSAPLVEHTITGGSISNCTFGVEVLRGGTTMTSVAVSNALTGVHVRSKWPFNMISCTVSGCGIGVEIAQIYPQFLRKILNSNFSGISNVGILMNDFSNVQVSSSIVLGMEGAGEGISLTSSSPAPVLDSRIEGFKVGLLCTDNSLPVLENGFSGGYNVITNNNTGVQCEQYSHANLGIADEDEGGQNSIHNNADYDAVITSGSQVVAQLNWWGRRDDPPGDFLIEDAELNYYPWLDYDPNLDGPPSGGSGTRSERLDLDPLMLQAIAEKREGRFADAANTLKTMIISQNIPISLKQWAVSMLLSVAQMHGELNLAAYIRQAIELYPTLRRPLISVLPHIYLAECDLAQALRAFDANIAATSDTNLVKSALYGKFLISLYTNSDTSTAQVMLEQLRNEFPASGQRRIAETQMGTFQAVHGRGRVGDPGKAVVSDQLPSSYVLMQNYPNPFNPTTIIGYELPAGSQVNLKVYDILGREVLILVDRFVMAGHHQVKLDASGLASGVYFYRLTAGSYTAIKKMVVTK
jgi:hypothetical protein